MVIFGPKPFVNPYGKMSIFRLFELLLFIALKGVFCLQNIIKYIFLAYIAKKKEIDKTAIFGQQPSVNPFEKMSIFRLFELLLFIALKGDFSFWNIVKDIFPAYIALPKKLREWLFLKQNHGLTPLEKCQFFDFFELVVFIA